MFRWLRRMYCRVFGHSGFYREWEWSGRYPAWKERDDAWTCIRCHREVSSPREGAMLYRVPRPVLDPKVVEIINTLTDTEQIEPERIRIRAGDVNLRQRWRTN
jgi:hypothetical protein